jgi:DNA-binding NarL/FixJ family response regulator
MVGTVKTHLCNIYGKLGVHSQPYAGTGTSKENAIFEIREGYEVL